MILYMYRIFLEDEVMTEFQQFVGLFETREKKQFFVDEQNTLWLNATAVCKKLGFKNVPQTIAMHTDEDERTKVDTGGLNDSWFISEFGVWGLILASKSEESKAFKRFLKHELLPSIRKEGGYVSPEATPQQLDNLVLKIAELRATIESTPKKPPGSTPGDAVLDGLAVPILNCAVNGGYDPSEVARSVKRRINQICSWELPGLSNHLSIGGTEIRSENFHLSEAIGL